VAPPSPLLAVPNVTAHPSTASVPTSYYSIWHSAVEKVKVESSTNDKATQMIVASLITHFAAKCRVVGYNTHIWHNDEHRPNNTLPANITSTK